MTSANIFDGLEALLPEWLGAQRWFSNAEDAPRTARIVDHEWIRDAWPKFLWTLVEVDQGSTYQIPIAFRQEAEIGAVLLGHGRALIGKVTDDNGETLLAYDALIDSTLGRVLFDVVSDGTLEAKSVRPIGAEQSNTSLVFDNRYILKVFRRLYKGSNPDLEVTSALTDAGFAHVAPVVAKWRRGDWDLAVCQPYLWDGTDGWKLALASVRDLLGPATTGGSSSPGSPLPRLDPNDPAAAGGDFADEARRLGAVTAQLHAALAEQFGTEEFHVAELVASLESGLAVVEDHHRPSLQALIDKVRELKAEDGGKACRIHGDYHLGQTLRSVSGWYIFDFEGEPARPLSERVRPTSPAKDVAGMLRSFEYAGAAVLFEQISQAQVDQQELAAAWEQRNRESFREGYLSVDGVEALLPPNGPARSLIFRAFEVEKAIYELEYEKAYRPSWVMIPAAALDRLLKV